MAKKIKIKKSKFNLKILILVLLITIFLIIFKNNYKSHPIPSYNYQFAYNHNGQLNVFDLKKNALTKLSDKNEIINYIAWSKAGNFAYTNDKGDLYSLDPKKGKPLKLSSGNFKDVIFWDNNSILYANESPIQRAYKFSPDTTYKEISIEEYNKKLNESLADSIFPASFDKSYYSKSDYTKDNIKTLLVDKIKNREYQMPDGAYRPQISPNKKYLAYNNNASDGLLYIFKFEDVKSGKFGKPVYKKEIGNYSWMDDSKILFTKKTSDPANTIYGIFNLKTGEEKIIYSVYDSPVYINDLYLTPDMKNLVLRKFKTDYFSGGELIFIDINTAREVRKIPFDYGEWSEPL